MAISANAGEYRSRIGLDSLYIALITADTAAAYTAGTPEYFAPAALASQDPNQASETQYMDDLPYDVMFSEGETKISLEVSGLPPAMYALILGRVFDTVSGRVFDQGEIPPYFALGFRSLKSDGSYRYYWFLKGRFDIPTEDAETKGKSASPKTTKLVYTAIFPVYKHEVSTGVNKSTKRVFGDSDTTNFVGTTWFNQVQVPSVAAPAALALSSSVPADAATGVSVTADQTLTFNNALPASAVNNIMLLKASDGSVIAGTITLDTAGKVVTINPTSSLSASTDYIITYAVTDIYAQTLKGAINFTTA